MTNEFEVQVDDKIYSEEYDTVLRFISYFYQIDIVKQLRPATVLEIGIGNRIVSEYLKRQNIRVDTCDFDKRLKPDHVADIRKLPFKGNSYDVIMACQILEHIPWKDVEIALGHIHRITRRYAVISVPYSNITFEFIMNLPLMKRFFKKDFFNFYLGIPHFYKKAETSGEHHWEMGRKSFSKTRFRNLLKKYFKIKSEIRPVLHSYHYFFVLEKKYRANAN